LSVLTLLQSSFGSVYFIVILFESGNEADDQTHTRHRKIKNEKVAYSKLLTHLAH